ncbi:hypothetical protein BpHYR1_021622 [Brachionus plicatilis]|uniref:Uncharacterized protein n=1 Tax=Brachionus plicatilis TaxID=10195 RepID=A0A3M7PH87_BRAPC|nr:hypothetical protein BpHYR1_021622 [Brachionus plicatilis]
MSKLVDYCYEKLLLLCSNDARFDALSYSRAYMSLYQIIFLLYSRNKKRRKKRFCGLLRLMVLKRTKAITKLWPSFFVSRVNGSNKNVTLTDRPSVNRSKWRLVPSDQR